jgi:hypothetical protein
MSTLGRAAYAGYGDRTGWKTYDGRVMPEWEELPERIREAWEAAGAAAVVMQWGEGGPPAGHAPPRVGAPEAPRVGMAPIPFEPPKPGAIKG